MTYERELVICSISLLLVVFSYLLYIFYQKKIYLIGLIFLYPFFVFGYKYLYINSQFEYLAEEEFCGIYEYELIGISSRPPYPKEYYIKFDGYGVFAFRSNAYPNRVSFENLNKKQEVCLVLKRRKDRVNDLSSAIIISAKFKK